MSNPNVINNDGNRTEGIARKGIATALAAIVTPFLFTACKADIATASAPSDAPNTQLPAASAPANPGSSETKPSNEYPSCKKIMEDQNITDPLDIKGFNRFDPNPDDNGWKRIRDIKGNVICIYR